MKGSICDTLRLLPTALSFFLSNSLFVHVIFICPHSVSACLCMLMLYGNLKSIVNALGRQCEMIFIRRNVSKKCEDDSRTIATANTHCSGRRTAHSLHILWIEEKWEEQTKDQQQQQQKKTKLKWVNLLTKGIHRRKAKTNVEKRRRENLLTQNSILCIY